MCVCVCVGFIVGSTARQDVQERPCDVGIRGNTDFVSGVCDSGLCITAMDFLSLFEREMYWGSGGGGH